MNIELPHVGESITEGIIGKWLVSAGDTVNKYDPLVEVTTDKVTMEVPSPAKGTISKILVSEGITVPVGTIIAQMEEIDAGNTSATERTEESPPLSSKLGVLDNNEAPVGPTGSGGLLSKQKTEPLRKTEIGYSPAVKNLAEKHKLDLHLIKGTGMKGRVTREDVRRFIESLDQPDIGNHKSDRNETRMPLSPVRRTIAHNMVKSSSEIPQAWSSMEVDMTNLVNLRKSLKNQSDDGIKLTYLAFILHAVAKGLSQNPLLNSSWDSDSIVVKHHINIGIAVATSEGLMVPVIHNADKLTVPNLALAVRDLSGKAREQKLSVEEIQGGTFTVNNTGVLGSMISRALINPPEAAILTMEAVSKRAVVVDDQIAIRPVMNMGITFDHRIIDGSEAGKFMQSVKLSIELVDSIPLT